MPGGSGFGVVPGAPPFFLPGTDSEHQAYEISGITKDSTGTPLPFCEVKLFETGTDRLLDQTTSDENGLYLFSTAPGLQRYCRAYLPGAPDVAGTTVNTLIAV